MGGVEGIDQLERIASGLLSLIDSDSHPAHVAHRAEVAKIVVAGNQRQLLAGKDSFGHPMARLSSNTLRYRKGSGPPTVPRLTSSGPIRALKVAWTRQGSGQWTLTMSWPGFPAAGYFVSGTKFMPRRDFTQIAPETFAEIGAATDRLAAKLADEATSTGNR